MNNSSSYGFEHLSECSSLGEIQAKDVYKDFCEDGERCKKVCDQREHCPPGL